MGIPFILISMVLFFVMFFGIGFILNMLLRMSWIMAIIYPIITLSIIGDVPFLNYATAPIDTLQLAWDRLFVITLADGLILSSGFVGAILSGVVIKMLRSRGYRMF